MVIPYMPMLVPPVKWTGYRDRNLFFLVYCLFPFFSWSSLMTVSFSSMISPFVYRDVFFWVAIVLAVMTKEHTCSYHLMSCARMELSNRGKQLRGLLESN